MVAAQEANAIEFSKTDAKLGLCRAPWSWPTQSQPAVPAPVAGGVAAAVPAMVECKYIPAMPRQQGPPGQG